MAKKPGTTESVYRLVEVIGTASSPGKMPPRMRWRTLPVPCATCALPK